MAMFAWPKIVDEGVRWPEGVEPFCYCFDLMEQATLYTYSLHSLSDEDLIGCPMILAGPRPWFCAYVSTYYEYFILFTQETHPWTGLPEVAAWKIEGRLDQATFTFVANGKLRIHAGRDAAGYWCLKFL